MSEYRVTSLRRYPVKSMRGEELDAVDVTERGLCGDRVYALVDSATGRIGSAKNSRRFGGLLKWRAEFVSPPQPDRESPAVKITMPDDAVTQSGAPELASILTNTFGPQVSLMSSAPKELLMEFPAGTLGGNFTETTAAPVAVFAPGGTFFDSHPVQLITKSSLDTIQAAYPEGRVALERFRPNIVIDCGDESGFVENAWVGRNLVIGEVILRVMMPNLRCVMTTLPHTDLPQDPGILRTVARLNTLNLGDLGNLPCLGIKADVVKAGRIQCGDTVRVTG